jgi:hypothetical protein
VPLLAPDIRQGAPHKDGCRVRANAKKSCQPLAARDEFEDAVDLVKESSAGDTLRTPNADPPARRAQIAHAGGLLIYLRHRGVLNVDEFRRTNARWQ